LASRKERLQSELLVLRYRSGDNGALAELVSLWERPLLYYIRRLVDSEEDAWDLLQDVWCRLIRNVGTLRNPAALPAWLYAIARNTVCNHLRDTRHIKELRDWAADADAVNGVAEVSFPAVDAEELHWALERLSHAHREALILHFLEGFSLAEIAAIVGAPVGTVKSRLHHAKRALRTVLEKEEQCHE